jgi:hypothetical protein
MLFTQDLGTKRSTFERSSMSTLWEDHEVRHKSTLEVNMTPNDPRTTTWRHKTSWTQTENSKVWIARIPALIVKKTTSKAHMKVHTNKESREKKPGRNRGRNGAVPADLSRPAQPTSGPVRRPVFPRCSSIYCHRLCRLPHRSNHSTAVNHQKAVATQWGRELDELVARINTDGGKEARVRLQAAGLRVFPSFIAAIFIDDILRSLHHPSVLQSL